MSIRRNSNPYPLKSEPITPQYKSIAAGDSDSVSLQGLGRKKAMAVPSLKVTYYYSRQENSGSWLLLHLIFSFKRTSVREVESSIPDDITSLFQLLSFLCSLD